MRMPSEDMVEMLAVAGLDFVVVDCEHGPADVLSLRHHIALAQLHGMAVLVRIGEGETPLAQRALDQGAQGVIAPHVDSRQDAEALVRAVRYPPAGTRGFATYPRAGRFGEVPAEEHRRHAEESTLVIVMLESPAAVAEAGSILRSSGVDGYLVGTADLQAASGPDDLEVAQALLVVRQHGREVGSLRADLAGDVDAARRSLDDGAHLVVYNLTQVLMGVFRRLRVES